MTKKERIEKSNKFAHKILIALSELMNEESDAFIDFKEAISDDETSTCFMHALSNMVPTIFLEKIGCDLDVLEHNHMANKLLFAFLDVNDEIDFVHE